MSNDTDFNLRLHCPSLEQLEHVMNYLEYKKERWDFWQGKSLSSSALMKRVGAEKAAAVVSWGFDRDGEIQVDDSGHASIALTAWANQNFRNVWISGEDGELADLAQRFSFLEITGDSSGEYGSSETIEFSGSDY